MREGQLAKWIQRQSVALQVAGSRFRVQGSGFKVQGSKFSFRLLRPTNSAKLEIKEVNCVTKMRLEMPPLLQVASRGQKRNFSLFFLFFIQMIYLDVKGRNWTVRSFLLIEQCPGPSFDVTTPRDSYVWNDRAGDSPHSKCKFS